MDEVITNLLVLALSLGVGFAVGYSYGEEHAIQVENAKLHEQCEQYEMVLADYRSEVAKLRELVRDYERCSVHADCDGCEYDGTTNTHCPLSPCFPDADELRKLGIEVD